MDDEFEKALKQAFETPEPKPGDNDPFSVADMMKLKKRTDVKTTKKRLNESQEDKESPPTITFPDSIPVEVSKIGMPSHKKTKITHGNAGPPNDPRKDKVHAMCVGYADGFPDVCSLPSGFSKDWSLEELNFVLDGFQRKVQSHNELEMLRTGLLTGASLIEQGSSFIPGQPIKLNGLADNFRASIQRFDACLREIAIKYSATCSFTPEQMLMMISLQLCIQTHEMNCRVANVVSQEEAHVYE